MSRRRSFPGRRLLAAVAGLSVVLAGCTPPNLPAPLPPDTTETAPSAPVVGGVISIGVDDDIRGFNPYVASQYSPAAVAISGLVLPSVFAPGATSPTDRPTALVTDVRVTDDDPFTVTYNLNQGAAWSDGTPIAAEDFTYLWRQMTTNTDVVSPGGYQLISGIQSADAGKTVIVVFKTAFADWRTLFSPLLPARTLKDEPGGFTAALQAGIPVAGSQYRMDSYDPVIGQIRLDRNDKYWAAVSTGTAASNSVIFRAGSSTDLVESLARGDLQAVYLQPGGQAASELAALNTDVRQIEVPLPATTELQFNTGTGRIAAAVGVRRAVAAGISTAAVLTALGDGNAASMLAATSQLTLPGDPDADLAAPGGATDNAAGVVAALDDLGYQRTGLYYTADGAVLTLVLGYLVGDQPARAAARLVQRQLGAVGIQVNLVAETASDFVAPLTVTSVPDLRLTTTPRSASDRSTALSVLDCTTAYDPLPTTSSSTSPTSSSTTTTAPVPTASACTAAVTNTLAGFLHGGSAGDLDAVAWSDLSVLPLAEPVAVLALGPRLGSVTLPQDIYGMLWGGPLRNLPEWPAPV